MNKIKELSLVIPTKNRKYWIERMLKYYIEVKFSGNIVLADSSDQYSLDMLLKKFTNKNNEFVPNIKIIHCPKLRAEEAISKALKYVKTKYVLVINDDDIILSTNLGDGIKFLERNEDYVGFIGRSFSIKTKNDQPFCKDVILKNYNLHSSSKNCPMNRCVDYISKPSNCVMVVMTTSLAKKAFSFSNSLDPYHQHFIFGEIIHGLIVCGAGKIKMFNFSYCVRQNHSQNEYNNLNFYKFITVSKWSKTYKVLKNLLLSISKKKLSKNIIFDVDELLDLFYTNTMMNILGVRHKRQNNLRFYLKKKLVSLNNEFRNSFIKNIIWYSQKFNSRKIKIDNDLRRYINIIKSK